MIVSMVVNFFNRIKSLFSKKVKKRFITDDEFNDMKKKREEKMNGILDKISKNGYESLSQHEKNFLSNYSSQR